MLKNIHVKNFALIDEVEIDLGSGLNVLSGETGAGKSIIIDAVNFALGQRVSKDVVRDDAQYALSELVFSVENEQLVNELLEFSVDVIDGELILSRKITQGKSVARVNGETVTAATLKGIASILIDIHGQHDNQSLLNPSRYLSLLDEMLETKVKDSLDEVSSLYAEYARKTKELEEIDIKSKDKERELSLLKFQVEEIEAANLIIGEDEEVEALYRKMSSAKKIAEAVTTAHRFTGYEGDGAGELIGRALSSVRQIADLDEEAMQLQMMLTDIDGLLNDFNRSVADYEASLEFSDEEFLEVESRINTLNTIKNKFGGTIEAALERLDEMNEEIDRLSDIEMYRERLKVETQAVRASLLSECEKLSSARISGAKELSEIIEKALLDLNFLDSKFEIQVTADKEQLSSKGYDKVEFLISTNPGERLKPLSEVASGGEMSRIMLAIKSVMASRDNIPTLIFDEIDTGISGRTAQKVSEKMSVIARDHQVICVTHLPQIAAMADSHFEIKKEASDSRTKTDITCLSEEAQIMELARMLGGASISDAVINNAKDMKYQADVIKGKM